MLPPLSSVPEVMDEVECGTQPIDELPGTMLEWSTT
jgi:hypothetical protein